MAKALYLSHWDAPVPVMIPVNVVKELSNYHLMGIRFLYSCYFKGQKGAILNEDEDMNFQIQIAALLSALHANLTIHSPAIVICDKQSLHIWYFYLSKCTNIEITVVDQSTVNYTSIILCTVENLKWFKQKDLPFLVVVIDDLDLNLNRKFVKQLKGKFNVGLTNRNFLRNPDQKLFRNMLLWAVPGVVGKLEEFCKEDEDHLNNLRFCYGEWWLHLPWTYSHTFKKPSQEEILRTAASAHKYANNLKNAEIKPRPRKKRRKANSPTSLKFERDSSQDTVICDQENDDFPTFSPIKNDIKPSKLPLSESPQDTMVEDDVLSMLLDEPKIELNQSANVEADDDLEARNREILSLLYGD